MKAHNFIDLTGKKFGRLTAIEKVERVNKKITIWICICDCGKISNVDGKSLRGLNTRSCGCLQKEAISTVKKTHGMTKSAEYKTWCGMKRRCYNKNEKCFARYGALGVTICDRWKNSFMDFFSDMGKRPSEKHSIDRIDSNGNYEPQNCRWVLSETQNRNRRSNLLITFKERTHVLADWAKETGISSSTIKMRLRLGWSIPDALTKPVRSTKKNPT